MPLAKAAADRRPRLSPQPDTVVKRATIAIAVGFGQAANDTDPWSNPKARVKPHDQPDVQPDLQPHFEPGSQTNPKPEGDPDATAIAIAIAIATAIAHADVESVPHADGSCIAERLAEHCPAGGRRDHDHRDELHAQQVGDGRVLQGWQQHCLLDEDSHRGVQRILLNDRQQSWRRPPHRQGDRY
jgi:hypothetical protein